MYIFYLQLCKCIIKTSQWSYIHYAKYWYVWENCVNLYSIVCAHHQDLIIQNTRERKLLCQFHQDFLNTKYKIENTIVSICIQLGPGPPSAGGPRMDRRVGVVKISRHDSRLRCSARRGPDPTAVLIKLTWRDWHWTRMTFQQKRDVTDTGPQMTFHQKHDVTDAGPRKTFQQKCDVTDAGRWMTF